MSDPTAPVVALEHTDVRAMTPGQQVDQVLVVRSAEPKAKRDGSPYLRLVLGDRTGSVESVAWSEFDRLVSECTVGALLRLRGVYEVHEKYGPRIGLRESGGQVMARLAREGEYDLARLVQGPRRAVDEIEADLVSVMASVEDPWLGPLLDVFFHDAGLPPSKASPFYAAFREAPAARGVHQAYAHGLLEHTVGVAQAVALLAGVAPLGPVNRDLAVAGALLHDIGKVDVYTRGLPAIEMTQLGKLHGEIPLTYELVRRAIGTLNGFPGPLADALIHIVVSHHGRLEWAAPVVPATREASLVHAVDRLASVLGSFDRLKAELPSGEEWTGYDRVLGTSAWFGEVGGDGD